MEFKFRFVKDGETRGFLRSPRGKVGDTGLHLGDALLRYDQIADTVARGDRLAIQLDERTPDPTVGKYLQESILVLEPQNMGSRRLELLIDQRCAAVQLEHRRRRARERGQEHLIRSELCATCSAEIDFTDVGESRYVYCPFCDTIFDPEKRTSFGRQFRTCDECGLFGRVQQYPEFYFYFLLVIYGFEYEKRFLCGVCAHRLFVKALLLNLVFLVGVPTAIWVKIKSVTGGRSGLSELRRANQLAKKGRLAEAVDLYNSILAEFPEHPGVLLNEGLARLEHGDEVGGFERLERALEACPNYSPLLRTVARMEQLVAEV